VRSAPYRRMSLEWSDRMAISSREHADIAHLIVRHDADGAYRAMKDHLTASGAVALSNLQNLRHKQKWGASD